MAGFSNVDFKGVIGGTFLPGGLANFGYAGTIITVVGSAPAAAVVPGASAATTLFSQSSNLVDFGSDVLVLPSLDPTLTLVNDQRVLQEALARRLMTPRGSLPFHQDYGLDLRSYLSENITPAMLFRIRSAVERECEADERVLSATAQVSFTQSTGSMIVNVMVATDSGPFRFTLQVSQLTVQLLGDE